MRPALRYASTRRWIRRAGRCSSGSCWPTTCRRAASSTASTSTTRGYLQCFVRWGANDGPDDAFENFNRWPELHALGAGDEILRMFLKGHEGLIKQYTEAKTTDVPIARQGMYYKEFIVQSDWMHHGEGLQLFNRMGLSIPTDAKYQAARAAVRRLLHGRGSRRRPTTIRRTRSSAACRTAAAGRCCARPRRSTGSAIRSTSRGSTPCTASRRSSSSSPTTRNTPTSPAITS